MLIDSNLAKKLINLQFPQYANLPIVPVKHMGHDNRTFRLGNNMLIRIPSAQCYAIKVEMEQKWLPKLTKSISLKIPKPLHMGNPSDHYPYNWSIYNWIKGYSLNTVNKKDLDLNIIAKQLAQFIKELHRIDTTNAPESGKRTFYRGCSPRFYDQDMKNYINQLKHIIDSQKALEIWENAIKSKWIENLVWIHGDLAIGNILIKDNRINAIIDFSGIAIGDPACDLVMYWNFFDKKSRDIFKSNIDLDKNTWNRARGWALWKACFQVCDKGFNSTTSLEWLQIINNILSE